MDIAGEGVSFVKSLLKESKIVKGSKKKHQQKQHHQQQQQQITVSLQQQQQYDDARAEEYGDGDDSAFDLSEDSTVTFDSWSGNTEYKFLSSEGDEQHPGLCAERQSQQQQQQHSRQRCGFVRSATPRRYTVNELKLDRIDWAAVRQTTVVFTDDMRRSIETGNIKKPESMCEDAERRYEYDFEVVWQTYLRFSKQVQDSWATFKSFFRLVLCCGMETHADLLVFVINSHPLQALSMLKQFVLHMYDTRILLKFVMHFERYLTPAAQSTVKFFCDNPNLSGMLDVMDYCCWLFPTFLRTDGSNRNGASTSAGITTTGGTVSVSSTNSVERARYTVDLPLERLNIFLNRFFRIEMQMNEKCGPYIQKNPYKFTETDVAWCDANEARFMNKGAKLQTMNFVHFLKNVRDHYWLDGIAAMSPAKLRNFNLIASNDDLAMIKVAPCSLHPAAPSSFSAAAAGGDAATIAFPKSDLKRTLGVVMWKLSKERDFKVQNLFNGLFEDHNVGISDLLVRNITSLNVPPEFVIADYRSPAHAEMVENLEKVVFNVDNYVQSLICTSAASALAYSDFELISEDREHVLEICNEAEAKTENENESVQQSSSAKGKVYVPSRFSIEYLWKCSTMIKSSVARKILDPELCAIISGLYRQFGDEVFSRRFLVKTLFGSGAPEQQLKQQQHHHHQNQSSYAKRNNRITMLMKMARRSKSEAAFAETVAATAESPVLETKFSPYKTTGSSNGYKCITTEMVKSFLERAELNEDVRFDVSSIPDQYVSKFLFFQAMLLRLMERESEKFLSANVTANSAAANSTAANAIANSAAAEDAEPPAAKRSKQTASSLDYVRNSCREKLLELRRKVSYVPALCPDGTTLSNGYQNWLIRTGTIPRDVFLKHRNHLLPVSFAMVSIALFCSMDVDTVRFFLGYLKSIDFPGNYHKFAILFLGASTSGKSQFVSDLKDVFFSGFNGNIHSTAFMPSKTNIMTENMFLAKTFLAVGEEIEKIDGGSFKNIVNNTSQTTRRVMRTESFENLRSLCKMILCNNKVPAIVGSDDGVTNRLLGMQFQHCFANVTFDERTLLGKANAAAVKHANLEFAHQHAKRTYANENNFRNNKIGVLWLNLIFGMRYVQHNSQVPVVMQKLSRKMESDTLLIQSCNDPFVKFKSQFRFERMSYTRTSRDSVIDKITEFMVNERISDERLKKDLYSRFEVHFNELYDREEKCFNFAMERKQPSQQQ